MESAYLTTTRFPPNISPSVQPMSRGTEMIGAGVFAKISSFSTFGFAHIRLMVVSFEHDANADIPMNVTLFGIVMEVKPWLPANAYPSIVVTLSGMVTDVSLEL